MKILQTILFFFLTVVIAEAQITTPVTKANFGVDADLRSNYINGGQLPGNDDWFWLPGSNGNGQFVIDTSGAAALLAGYAANPELRKLPFYSQMRFAPYSVVNNKVLMDANFVRDYHGSDSTVFTVGAKNGTNPRDWSCAVAQSIPDKNDLLDMMMHVRRDGTLSSDSLWLFGGLSIENTVGNRYFDFEVYQTDIYYDRTIRKFINYGPDSGHTRWQFDSGGNITISGDIIFTAEYSGSGLSYIEARIWINRNDLTVNSSAFSFTGSFDGASSGSQFGYAGIQPKNSGTFYTGLQNSATAWAGPFGVVRADNTLATDYTVGQFMDFSVNLSKLGLGESTMYGGNECQMPFRRILVKTRASTSFTAELKDFIAPFDFFVAPPAEVETDAPFICNSGSVAQVSVINPISSSIYQWSTINGHIVGNTTGPIIYVDTPGVYFVVQQLQTACSVYATDTVTVGSLGQCLALNRNLVEFNSSYKNGTAHLTWKVLENQLTSYFLIERSFDGNRFEVVGRVEAIAGKNGNVSYYFLNDVSHSATGLVFFRVRLMQHQQVELVSRITKHSLTGEEALLQVAPNPVSDRMSIRWNSEIDGLADINLVNQQGVSVFRKTVTVTKGSMSIELNIQSGLPNGYYLLNVRTGVKSLSGKVILMR